MRPARLFLGVIVVYAFLALNYIEVTPYRTAGKLPVQGPQLDIGAPDERQHVNYVRHVARTFRFPVFDPEDPNLYETYQSHQPPLYYVLAAPFSLLAGDNLMVEKWGLRLVNVVLGSLLLLGVFAGVSRFTGNETVALFCAAFVGLLPMFIALSSAVTNDILMYLMIVWGMNRIAVGLDKGWTTGRSVSLGVILGLGLLTKSTMVVMFPVGLAALLLWRERRASAANVLACLGVALLIGGPWLMRNHLLYGDPLAMGAFQQAFEGTQSAQGFIDRIGLFSYWTYGVARSSMMAFWGVFSYMEINYDLWVYYALTGFGAVALAGLGLRLARRQETGESRMHVLNAVLFLCVLGVFIRFNMVYFQAQGRYLYPAIFPIAAAIGFGIWELAASARDRTRAFAYLGGALLFALFALNLYAVLYLLPFWFTVFTEAA